MKTRTGFVAAAVLLLGLASVPFVYAQGFRHRGAGPAGEHGGGDGSGMPMLFGRLEKIRRALDLTDDQVSQIEAIGQALHAQNAPYREQLHTGMQAVAQTLLNNPNDTAAAQAIIDQNAAARAAMQVNVLAATSKALNVLTPDQRGKIAHFLAEREARLASR